MTDQLDTAVVQAGLDLLTADAQLTVYDSLVPVDAPRPYVLVYGFAERPEPADSDGLDGLSKTINGRWICHCVGDNRQAATIVAQRVRTQLLDATPVIAGFSTAAVDLVKQESAQPPVLDKSTGVDIYDATVAYRCRITI